MEKEDRYDVMLDGNLFYQLYFNLRGYVGYLPSPPENPGDKPGNLTIGEKGISVYKKEVVKLNKEWAEHRNKLESSSLPVVTQEQADHLFGKNS